MRWKTIDTQLELDTLAALVCWEDSRVLEYHGGLGPRPHLPADVSRSGYEHPDLHVLVDVCAGPHSFLELAFVHCERLAARAFERLTLRGRIDALKRIELLLPDGTTLLRAGRLAYRWLEDAPTDGTHYWSHRDGE